MMIQPPPQLQELRIKERMTGQGQNIPKFSRKSALIGIAIVLILTIAGLVLLYTLH